MSLLIRFVKIIQKIKPSRFNLNLVELWNRGECGQFPCWPIIIVDLRTVICCTMPLITTTTVRTGKSGTLSQRSAGWKLFYYFIICSPRLIFNLILKSEILQSFGAHYTVLPPGMFTVLLMTSCTSAREIEIMLPGKGAQTSQEN